MEVHRFTHLICVHKLFNDEKKIKKEPLLIDNSLAST